MRARLLGVVVWLALAFAARHAPASPLELFGMGGRSPALGQNGAALACDFDCVFLNPAGLADVARKTLTIGTLFGRFALNGVDRVVDDPVGVEVGGAFRLPFGGILRDRIGFGFAVYVPTSNLNRVRAPVPGAPFYTLLEDRSQVVGIQLGFGGRLTDRWSLGAGVLVLAALKGHIDVAPDPSGRFATTSEQQLIANYAPIFGVRFLAHDQVTLAATLHLRSESRYDILITNRIGDALPVTLPELRVHGVAQYDPLALVLEAAWRVRPDLTAVVGLAYEQWSDYGVPTENVLVSMSPQEPSNFHDTVIPRIGVEYRTPIELVLRGGAAFVMSPAPAATGVQAFIDNHRQIMSVGLGYSAGPFRADAWGQLHLLLPRHHDRPGDALDIDSGGSILVGGVTIGVEL